jgi:hypothetical protein
MSEEPDTGRLEEPEFIRGFDPLAHKWRPPPKPSPWKRHFELGRMHPGQWMKVGEYKKGGPRARRDLINRDRGTIARYIDRYWPLERWQLRKVTLDGTWCDRELYMRFVGTLTPEEDAIDRQRRAVEYEARMKRAVENKARRAAAARQKAQEEEANARVRIRARRRPGG